MPIFPQYGQFSTNYAVQTNPSAPSDPMPKQIEGLGQATEHLGTVVATVEQKKRELLEEADATNRAASAVQDMETIHQEITSSRENSLRAREYFDRRMAEVQPNWYKGLSQREQALLQRKLYGRTLDYRVGAAKIGNRAAIQETRGALDTAGRNYADVESRRTDPSDATDTPEYKDFLELGNAAVERNAMTPQEWEDKKAAVLATGAYSRAHKIIASDNSEEVKHLLDIIKESEAAPDKAHDKTFLRNVQDNQRATLKSMAQERIGHLRSQAVALKNQEWTDTQRMRQVQHEGTARLFELKIENPQRWGTLTPDDVESAIATDAIDPKLGEYYRTAAFNVTKSGTPYTGGKGNPQSVGYWQIATFTTKSPEDALSKRAHLVQDIIDGKVPRTAETAGWVSHLTAQAEPSVRQQTPVEQASRVRELIKTLRVSGPGATTISDAERSVEREALMSLDEYMRKGGTNPYEDVWLPRYQNWAARVGTTGAVTAQERARSLGIDYSAKRDNAPAFEAARQTLQQQYQSAPPGPEGDAIRRQTLEAVRRLRELVEADKALKQQQDRINSIKQQRSQREGQKSSPSSSGGGPLPTPRQ